MKNVPENKVGTLGTRGIIVVDRSVLGSCTIPIADTFLKLKGKPTCMADALDFLAQHGYEVIVTEMAAYIDGAIVRDGTPRANPLHNAVESGQPRVIGNYLQKIARSPYTMYIAAPASKDMTQAAQYINGIWRMDQGSHANAYVRKYNDNFPEFWTLDIPAAAELVKLLRKNNQTQHLPVFFFSHNKKAAEAISAVMPEINFINLSGLYVGLKDKGLLEHINLIDFSFGNFSAQIEHNLHSLEPKHAVNAWVISCAQDEMGPGKNFVSGAHPFAQSLKGLKEEIAAGKKTSPDNSGDAPRPPKAPISAAANRAAQWAAFAKPKGGSNTGKG